MTEQSSAERAHDIGMDAIDWDMVRGGVGDPQEAASIAVRAALEAAEQERDNWKLSAEEAERAEQRAEKRAEEAEATAEHLHDEDAREIVALTQERDAALAVIEKVRAYAESIPRTRDRDVNPDLSNRAWLTAQDVLYVLTSAGADVLREHDAKVRAEALREAYADLEAYTDSGAPFGHRPVEEFLLHRADRIEREAGLK